MSTAAELIAKLRAVQDLVDRASQTTTAIRGQFDGLVEDVRIATDGSSHPAPGEMIVRWQTGQIHLDEAVAEFQAAKAAIDDYITTGLGGTAGATTPPPVPPQPPPTRPAPPPPAVPPQPTVIPAGQWRSPPGKRRHDSKNKTTDPTFNADYEHWVKVSNGGPNDDREYFVRGNGREAFFDARRIETRDGKQVEVLIDAKGRYDQFLDPKKPSKFQGWWTRLEGKGLRAMLDAAERQIVAADGRPVEWWCAERRSARAFQNAINSKPKLRDKIKIKHRPMPRN